jgi:hypothetical protein
MRNLTSPSYAAQVYGVSPTEPNPQFRLVGSIVATAEESSEWWQIQVHQNLLHVRSEASGGIVWAFESGRYIPVPIFRDAEEVDHVGIANSLTYRSLASSKS